MTMIITTSKKIESFNDNFPILQVTGSVDKHQGNKKRMIMSSKREDKKTIHDLPEEVLTLILVRLSLKDILHCRSVEKSWHSLVKSPYFITIHLNYQKMINQSITTHSPHHRKYLFFEFQFSNKVTVRFDDKQCEEYCTLKFPPDFPQSVWLAQSYGLICVTTLFDCGLGCKPDTYLWNPLIQKYKTLPDSPLYSFQETRWTALAFGFLPQVNDYVVVHIVKPPLLSEPDPHSVMIGVYSLNTNSWKITSQDNVHVSGISEHNNTFVDGVAYWLGIKLQMSHQTIMCFDTKSGILREISFPDRVENKFFHTSHVIHPFRQSIAYFVEDQNFFDMWALKGDPINEFSWEKKMSVSLSKHCGSKVLGIRNNGEPILFNDLFNIVSYSLDSHEANDFVDSWDRWGNISFHEIYYGPTFFISPFVESLILLN